MPIQLALFTYFIMQFSHAQEVLPKIPPSPADNSPTISKTELGKALFFDPRLSLDGTVSCNSCHNVMAGGEDGRAFSAGVKGQLGGRSAPTVWNAAFQTVQFWDGRAASLEDQAKGPITNPIEMAMPNHEAVISRIKRIPGYVSLFEKAFGSKESVNIDNLAKAIATFERTLVTPNAKFDRYLQGNKKALNTQELKGFRTMQAVGCFGCHSGPNLSGPNLANGEGFFMKFPTFPGSDYERKYELTKDLGRFAISKNEVDKHIFRVPSLRNIALTAPYFHNGSVNTLAEAVRVMAKTQLNKDLSQGEVANIVSFLGTLTGQRPKILAPQLPDTPNETILIQ